MLAMRADCMQKNGSMLKAGWGQRSNDCCMLVQPETRFPKVPDTFPKVPYTFPKIPDTFPKVPDTFPQVPYTFTKVPDMFP